MGFDYSKLQPWVEVIIDALENKGPSSSGVPNLEVYPYSAKYKELLRQVRNKECSEEFMLQTLDQYQQEIESVSNQKYRTKMITEALKQQFSKELMKAQNDN